MERCSLVSLRLAVDSTCQLYCRYRIASNSPVFSSAELAEVLSRSAISLLYVRFLLWRNVAEQLCNVSSVPDAEGSQS